VNVAFYRIEGVSQKYAGWFTWDNHCL
jgi:hypothetical protein